MKSILAASATLVLAGGLAVPLCLAQTPLPGQPPPLDQPPAAASTTVTTTISRVISPADQLRTGLETPDTTVTPTQTSQGLPAGNYLSSCSDAHMVGGVLVASCDAGNDDWRPTALPQALACDGAIDNVGGRLSCVAVPEIGSSTPPRSFEAVSPAYPNAPMAPGGRAPRPVYQDLSPGRPLGPVAAPDAQPE